MTRHQVVGAFRSGRLVDSRPESLPTWRVTTAHRHIATGVGIILGGTTTETSAGDGRRMEILTTTRRVPIIVESPDDVASDKKQWGHNGIIHHCDGVHFLSPADRRGELCGCPKDPTDQRIQAKSGLGPHPSTTAFFRLADRHELGIFKFHSTSWSFAETIPETRKELAGLHRNALCALSIDTVEFSPTDGGIRMRYRKPDIRVLGPWKERINR